MNDTDKILSAIKEIQSELKSTNKRLDQLENGQKDLQNGQKDLRNSQKDIRETMATKEDIAEMKTIQLKQGTDIRIIKEDIKTIELKVAHIHTQNDKEHREMMDALVEGNEINYKALNQDLKKLEARITTLEDHTGLSNPIKH